MVLKIIITVLFLLFIAWMAVSTVLAKVKEPAFTIIKKGKNIEVRSYESFIIARVEVQGNYMQSQNDGFRILARYIFGGNLSKESIAMTAPVMEESVGVKIAMTAPVMEQPSDSGRRYVSFVMPAEYTLATLPLPIDNRIEIIEVPARNMAVLKYSWWVNEQRLKRKQIELNDYIQKNGYETVGLFIGARYNPPWTPPFLLRNEIMIQLK